MNIKDVNIIPEKCTNCLTCMLICSYIHTKSFNPSKSKIKIKPSYYKNNEWVPTEITFEECKEDCKACLKYCVYKAITIKR